MDNSIYEVDKEEYKIFLEQLNGEKLDKEESWLDNVHITKLVSKKTNKHLCSRVSDSELKEEHYYIFNYPDNDERAVPKPVCTIKLESKEEVQAFVDILNKIQKEKKND